MNTEKKHATAAGLESISAKARRIGVHRSTLQAWIKEGVEIHDESALESRLARRQLRMDTKGTEPAGSPTACPTGETYTQARLRREIANANLAELEEKQLRGELIEAASIHHQGSAIGLAVRRELEAMSAQLPARIAGRTAAECAEILHAETRRILNELSDRATEQFFTIKES